MRSLGFETLLPDRLQAPIIVTFHMPADPNFVFQTLLRQAAASAAIVIYPGKLTVADSFRIGCIGRLGETEMKGALAAVREVLARDGRRQRAPPARRQAARQLKEYDMSTSDEIRHRQRPALCLAEARRSSWSASTAREPDYIERAIEAGAMPWLAKVLPQGTNLPGRLRRAELHQSEQPLDRHRRAARRCTASAATIFYDREAGTEVMMNDPKYLRAETILAAFPRPAPSSPS